MKAIGKYVILHRLATEREKQVAKIGLVISDDVANAKREGATTLYREGKIISLGVTAQKNFPDLKEGDTVLYNPFDEDPTPGIPDTYVVDSAALVAKLV